MPHKAMKTNKKIITFTSLFSVAAVSVFASMLTVQARSPIAIEFRVCFAEAGAQRFEDDADAYIVYASKIIDAKKKRVDDYLEVAVLDETDARQAGYLTVTAAYKEARSAASTEYKATLGSNKVSREDARNVCRAARDAGSSQSSSVGGTTE